MSELAYFGLLVADPSKIPLFEAASSLGKIADSQVDLSAAELHLERLCKQLAYRCKDASTELARLQCLTLFFFRDCRFAGNINNYYDPDNSYLHRVLETRRGIPITLTLVFCELARSIGLRASGLAFPGHFLIQVKLHNGTVVIDPFTGRSLSHEDLSERAGPLSQAMPSLMQAASPRQILSRMLNNLHQIYSHNHDVDSLAQVEQRLEILRIA